MATLAAAAAPWITGATTALTVYSMAAQGKTQQQQAELVARQRESEANREQVAAQQVAAGERKKARLVRSRALAVAGASGAGVSDPTVTNILTDIDTEGEYRALSALASGDTTAQGYRRAATYSRNEGNAARSAGYLSAGTTALSGATSFYEKYGDIFDPVDYVTTTPRRM